MIKINITINPKTGEKTYDIEGALGVSCTDLTNVLTRGEEVKEQTLKASYFDAEQLPIYESNE